MQNIQSSSSQSERVKTVHWFGRISQAQVANQSAWKTLHWFGRKTRAWVVNQSARKTLFTGLVYTNAGYPPNDLKREGNVLTCLGSSMISSHWQSKFGANFTTDGGNFGVSLVNLVFTPLFLFNFSHLLAFYRFLFSLWTLVFQLICSPPPLPQIFPCTGNTKSWMKSKSIERIKVYFWMK